MDPNAQETSNRYPPSALLTTLLRDVSRSFYWTLRILPRSIRPQIGLAYLLARTTDTIADTELVPVPQRLQALQALRERIFQPQRGDMFIATHSIESPSPSGAAFHAQPSPAEKNLLTRIDQMLSLLAQFSMPDQQLIREVLSIITSGQELDLRRFGNPDPGQILALQTDEDLDDYTYRVAGCVGEFWTKICRRHLFPNARLDDARLLENGIRFGKGLQLVNVLRDLPADLRRGRCYLPFEPLTASGLTPQDLLHPENEPRFRPFYAKYLAIAHEHLAAGWEYTNMLPSRCLRLRLACAWPILIGVKTLAKLKAANVLEAQHRIKITRSELKILIARSILSLPCPPAWRQLFTWAAKTAPNAANHKPRTTNNNN